jgi:hypothetical protein
MFKSNTLDALGQKHGTDKSSGPGAHDYLRKYEFFLRAWKDLDFTFLELGVFKGASLRVWSEYFTKAKIVGVDIEPKAQSFDIAEATLLIGDLANDDFLGSLAALNPKVILDDASHWWPDQLRSLFGLYPGLQSGGLYIIEDIHTSFEPLAPHFAAGYDTPPFYFCLKLAEYLTGNDRPAPIFPDKNLVPLARDDKHNLLLRAIADLTDSVIFIERACLLVKK